jgi:hypothetical protein
MSIVEIREFIDDSGSCMKREVVNVEDEMNQVLSQVEQYKAAKKRDQDLSDDDETKKNDDIDIEKLRQSFLQSINPTEAELDVS